MWKNLNEVSTIKALNRLQSALKNTGSNESIMKIYVKISSQFDNNLNATSFINHLRADKPTIIVFEFNTTDTKIFWRQSGKELYVLKIQDDVNGNLSLFCANFIADEIKSGYSGILPGWDKSVNIEIRSLGNQKHQNIIIRAVKDGQSEIVSLLVKQAIDIDYKDEDKLSAMDHAWKDFINITNDSVKYAEYNKIVLSLLNANSKYPEDKSCLTLKYYSTEIKKFVDDHRKLHDQLENHEIKEMKSELSNMSGNLCHFYDINNVSLMNHAVQNYNIEVYKLLSSLGITLGSHEDPDEVFIKIKSLKKEEKRKEITSINENNALDLLNIHINTIISKVKVINNCGNQHRHRTKDIMDALIHIDSNESCSKVLKVIAACKNLTIYVDFKYEAVNFIDISYSKETLGLTTKFGTIKIGAKCLLDESKKNKFMGVLIHEFCHLAFLMTFLNNFKPYAIGDEDTKNLFEDAFKECFQNRHIEVLIDVAFDYEESHQHDEVIVSVLHMVMAYHAILEPDGTSKIDKIKGTFKKLFTYFDEIVGPALDNVLDSLKILQNGELDITYEDLTQSHKNRIKHNIIDFQGADTTFFDVLGEDEEIYKLFTKKELREYLLTVKTTTFKDIEIKTKFANIERQFIDENATNQCASEGFSRIKEDLEDHSVFLLIDRAGAGKTEAFIDLSKRLKDEHKNFLVHVIDMKNEHVKVTFTKWTLKINHNDQHLDTEAIEKIFLDILNLKSKFEKQIFHKLFNMNKVIFLFDGIDKLQADTIDLVLQIIILLRDKTPYVDETTVYKPKVLISSCPTTLIKSKQLCPKICQKSYKLMQFSPSERISYIYDFIANRNQSERVEEMVWYVWFFNQVDNDNNHQFTNLSLIKTLTKQHINQDVNLNPKLCNLFYIFNDLYKFENITLRCNTFRSFNLHKIHQVYALPALIGKNENFLLAKSWDKEKRHWKSQEFEEYGYLYVNIEDSAETNSSDFVHPSCAEYFLTVFLFNRLFAENHELKTAAFKSAVEFLRIIGKSAEKYKIVHKLLFSYIKIKNDLTFFEEAKNQLIEIIDDIRQDILSAPNLVDSLKFWSLLLSKDTELLHKLWLLDEEENLLKTVIIRDHKNVVNFFEIIKIVSNSFGDNWHPALLKNFATNENPVNGLTASNCGSFNINLKVFIEFVFEKFENKEIQAVLTKFLTNSDIVKHINLGNIQTCLTKCREIFNGKEEFFVLIFSKILHFTNDSNILQYYGNNFEDTLQNNKKSIEDVLFSKMFIRPLIMTSMSHSCDTFHVFKNLYIKFDKSNTNVQNYFNENGNILKVFFLMTEHNYMDVIEYLKSIFASNQQKLVSCIKNVEDELNDLTYNKKSLEYFFKFLSETAIPNNYWKALANTTLISQSICVAIEKFYSIYSRNVDIIDFNGSQSELIGEILQNLNNSMTVTVYKMNNSRKVIESQTILLFDKFDSLNNFNMQDAIDIKFINPIRLLVYCVNSSELEISSLKTDLVTPPYYYFLIIGNSSKINLWTFENQKDLLVCHENQTLVKINEFSSSSLTWKNNKIFPNKYKNFHGCVMNIGLNILGSLDRANINIDKARIKVTKGLKNSLLLIMGERLNFILHSFECLDPKCLDQIDANEYLYNIMVTPTIDSPQLLIPPGDLYTSIEKMLLPFDTETWIGLLAVFVSGTVTISIISQFPARIRETVFGKNIGIPNLNFFLAFFGEAQKRSPDGTFARIIWIFFIFYCLVIRTCYQGKLFEFTTTAVRKPEHKTLDDLKNRNFTLYFMDEKYTDKTIEFVNNGMGLHIEFISEFKYSDIYLENMTDPSFTGTLFSSDLEQALNAFYLDMPISKRFIPTPFTKSYYGIGFLYPNLWSERFNEIISDLITGGFVNYHLEEMTQSKWNLMPSSFEPENIVLNLHHLGFGFQICLIFAYLSFVTFLAELGYFWFKSFYKNYEYSREKICKHRIIMVLSAKTPKTVERHQLKPKFRSAPATKINKLHGSCTMIKFIHLILVSTKVLATIPSTTLISLSICGIIEKFYSIYSRNVDIIDFNGSQSELVGEILRNLNNSMTVTVYKLHGSRRIVENQTILLFDNFASLNDFNNADQIDIKYINPIRLLVYCVNTSEFEISRLKTDLVIPPYYYFLTFGSNSRINLWTFENRNDLEVCHEIQTLIKINEFSTTNLSWKHDPIFPKKYKNFHGCLMNIGMNGFSSFDRAFLDNNGNQMIVTAGLKNRLLIILGVQLNFTLNSFQCLHPECLDRNETKPYLYNIMYFSPQLLIPPGDLYTSIEKMLLPFDTETWIGLVAVFVSGTVTISIISQFPARIRETVFGKNIGIPNLNFFLAFFGEAQKRSPDGTFARIIWIFFIFYCLVIRTCYQGKLFEFTTTAVRKPEYKTLDDLKNENFTLYISKGKHSDKTIKFIDSAIGLPIEYVSDYEYSDIYIDNISDPSFKGTLFSSDLEHAMNVYYLNMPIETRFIPTPFTKSYYAIGFIFPNLWNERFKEIISDLITGGFVNYHLELMTKSKWNMIRTSFEPENIVLNLHHLGFGFQICLIFAYLSFVTFLAEIGYFSTVRYWRRRASRHKIIMVLSASKNQKFNLNKNHCENCAEQLIQSNKQSALLSEDENSSDDSNTSAKSMLGRAFGRRVKPESVQNLENFDLLCNTIR
ncbi:unnamed protein product [Chironomus riparius]|uniref:Uncharacterized protein n=1 Tax=Chironomus riparius TaxID=315576 RepID=A0A9N9WVV5_9DIPT|nr:unnamed protein product [Chironomus riparius]